MKRRQALSTLFMASAAATLGISAAGAAPAASSTNSSLCEIPTSLMPGQTTASIEPHVPQAPSGPYKLPSLGFAYDALEPAIDAQTMELHYTKHHAGYIEKLNSAIASAAPLVALSKASPWPQNPEDLFTTSFLHPLKSKQPELYHIIVNNGGGHVNHSFFWKMLKKNNGTADPRPKGELLKTIEKSFGSFNKFQDEFHVTAKNQFGSGWAWLSVSPEKNLVISSTPNQESPLIWYPSHTLLLGLDVWEHAYYLKYQNRRDEYIRAFMSVINWDYVSERYTQAIHGHRVG